MKKRFLILIYLLVFSFMIFSNVWVNVDATGLGEIKYTYSRTILKDMNYKYVESNNGSPQRAYVLDYNPKTTGVDCVAVFGEEYFGGDKISKNISLLENKGYTVVAGVNASPFDTSNGVTVGTTISNGRIVVSTNGALSENYDNFAICKDGSAYIGHPNFGFSYTINGGGNIKINYLNRQKKAENDNVYLISSDFSSDTKTTAQSCEAVLSVTKGDLIVGTTIECSVDSVKENTTRTKVEKGKLVLVGPSNEKLGNLKVGDKIEISINDNDPNFDWTKCSQTISGFYQILGINPYSKKDTKQALLSRSDRNDRHPRTTLGYTADGKIVIYVADGRQPGLAVGMTDLECSEYMESLGCIAAIRMDGGGSSNLGIRLPGDNKVTTVNIPSDGEERSDADAFLLVLKDDYNQEVNDTLLLHAYPNDLKLLENTVTSITVKATDENYNPKEAPEYTMTVLNECGEIVDGRFKARSGSGKGKIEIRSGNVKTEVNVSVTNTVDELYANVNNLALAPNDKVKLSVKAYNASDLLVCSNESFTWKCDSEIGTIDKKGNFTATSEAGKNGYITISYGKVSTKVLVTIGQLPIEITGFETEKNGVWKNSQVNGGSGSCEINTDINYVRYGYRSLKINFNLKDTTVTVGTQIWTGSNIQISGTPTAIGMWVYATESAQGAWIRMQYAQSGSTGALYADFGHIDWLGWKYLEAPIEKGIKYPISVKYLVRIMAVNESERINGVIYVDGLRAVYGFANDDLVLPKIENISPVNFTSSTQQTISFDMLDMETGINKDKTEFYLDDAKIDNLIIKDIPNGFNVSFTPSALIPLNNGRHKVNVRVEDNSGNFSLKEWSFVVDNTLPKFEGVKDGEIKMVSDSVKYKISANNTNFDLLTITLQTNLELEDVKVKDGYSKDVVKNTDNTITIRINNNGSTSQEIVELTLKATNVGEVYTNISASFEVNKYENTKFDIVFNPVLETAKDNASSILEYITSKIDNFFK